MIQDIQFITVPSATSTNSLIRELDPPHATAVHAIEQTMGRGQRGNSWESQPGKNITLSLMLRPEALDARCQFLISQAVAVAAADFVSEIIARDGVAQPVTVKWPNDIYVGNRKIAGILIENTLASSRVSASIVGIGLNVNQLQFFSDAPNPVSLANLTARVYDPVLLARELASRIVFTFEEAQKENGSRLLDCRYLSMLYRRSGLHRWREAATAREFDASVHGIDSFGRLLLLQPGHSAPVAYEFKEIVYI